MKTKLRRLPLLKRLKHKRNCTDVGAIKLLKYLGSLFVILGGWASDKGKPSEVDHGINDGLSIGAIKVFVHRTRKVESSGVNAHHSGSTAFKFRYQRDVVCVIFRIDVRLLQNETDSGGSLHIDLRLRTVFLIVPLNILFIVLEHDGGRNGVPDGFIRQKDGLHHLQLIVILHGNLHFLNVILSKHEEHGLDILRRSSQPVLEAHHERPCICRFIGWQKLQHLRKCAEELQHTLLEGGSVVLLLLLHKFRNHRFRLSKVLHCEGSNLIEAHDFWHGRENETSIKIIAKRLHHLHDLLRQFLHEDKRSYEDVGVGHISLELFKGVIISELFEQISDALDSHIFTARVNAFHGSCHRGLVLRFEHDVHNFVNGTISRSFGGNATAFRVRSRVPSAAAHGHGFCGGI
mmetsp:Transcript_30071/g.59533  ORF Transcript_30071/g.59533 Transcript_30071/m.59533 type:complete len:404 (-) Transcript_30071:310-1521(-)